MLRRRLAWLAAVIPLIVMAIVTCDDNPATPVATSDSGQEPGVLIGGVCPDASPEAGEGCVVPEGTTCAFGACETADVAQCSNGTWRLGGNPTLAPACPTAFPTSESPCPPCFPTSVQCMYGSCETPDATANESYAYCDAGRWAIATVQCTTTLTDAGADVQGDADAESD